jgi:histidyl-tRNA synthetase
MKYADRRGASLAVIQGADERARGEVQIKDLEEGARLAVGIEGHDAWREAKPAQVSVPEDRLVEWVADWFQRRA